MNKWVSLLSRYGTTAADPWRWVLSLMTERHRMSVIRLLLIWEDSFWRSLPSPVLLERSLPAKSTIHNVALLCLVRNEASSSVEYPLIEITESSSAVFTAGWIVLGTSCNWQTLWDRLESLLRLFDVVWRLALATWVSSIPWLTSRTLCRANPRIIVCPGRSRTFNAGGGPMNWPFGAFLGNRSKICSL